MLQSAPWIPAVLTAICAGVLDWRYRRIPNWLTVSGALAGLALNTSLFGWSGFKSALLGLAVGLGLLLPFALLRSLGFGDCKLAAALGACVGPQHLITILMGTILAAGIMALAVVIWKRRLLQTLKNVVKILVSFLTFRMPGSEVSLDNPQSTKVPFGVAMALTVVAYSAARAAGKL